MREWINGYLKKLDTNRQENLAGGGPERIELQHSLGKLTARERIEKLADPNSFDEIGSLVRDERDPFDGKKRPSPAEGIVMGNARVNGRPVMVFSLDFTVMSGSLGDQAAWKLADIIEIAGKKKMPIVGMMDSAGERLSLKGGNAGMHGLAKLIRNYCLYSGVVPRIMMLLGPCIGSIAALPGLADFLIINQKTGFLWLGGEIKSKEAGKADFHMQKAGQCDVIVDSDEEAIEKTKELLEYLPQSCWEKPLTIDTGDDPERAEESLLDVMPNNPKFTYDIHEIIEKVVDNGKFYETKEDWASHLVTGFARIGGKVVGIVANNPDEMSGIFEIDAADKYDRFMYFLNSFNIPLITLVDSTAYVPGDRWERAGILRHGAKNLHTYSHVTSQKITIVLRRAYGGANITMGCSRMCPDYIFGWPTGEFAPTGPEAIVYAIFHKELAEAKKAGNYDELYDSYLSVLKEQMNLMNAKTWTSWYIVQEPIDPRKTRSKIYRALLATDNKSESLPEKKGAIKPA